MPKDKTWQDLIDYKHYHVIYTFSETIHFKPKVKIEEDKFALWISISIGWFMLIFADCNRMWKRKEKYRAWKT